MLPKPKKIQTVYLDHAAATPVDKTVFSAMKPFFSEQYGNPSSLHTLGQTADKVLSDCRARVAKCLGTLSENIIFTSSGTESDNLAIYGIAKSSQAKGHIISTAIEHDAVLGPLKQLQNWACLPAGRQSLPDRQGWEITYIQPDRNGLLRSEDVIQAIRPDTILVSVMYANNEIGTIAPIAEIGRKILQYRKQNNSMYPFFHTDACQAAGYLDLSVDKLHVDLMTINSSKIYGPKGAAMLYVRNGVPLKPILVGGGQEKKLRSGTEDLPGIVGFTKALELAQKNKDKESKRVQNLTTYFLTALKKVVPDISLNGPEIGEDRLCNNLNINFSGLEAEALLLYLNEYGVMCSVGSACSSKTLETSHVLRALGLSYQAAQGSIRFSFGKSNSKNQIDYIMKYLPKIVEQLREVHKIK